MANENRYRDTVKPSPPGGGSNILPCAAAPDDFDG
jgi:hypothetical protein